MKDTLHPGATAQFSFRVPAEKTVPHLYPEAPEFKEMPTVFATGFMVGLMEWTCLKVLAPPSRRRRGQPRRAHRCRRTSPRPCRGRR